MFKFGNNFKNCRILILLLVSICTSAQNDEIDNQSGIPLSIDVIKMVSIPGGSFSMGSDEGELDEKPVHTVTIDGFEMSATEITNAQYAGYLNEMLGMGNVTVLEKKVKGVSGTYNDQNFLYMDYEHDSNNRCDITYDGEVFSVNYGKENCPVVAVTWYGAKAFATYYGFDLPTEAEWEYAASGGKQNKYGTVDGTMSPSKANYDFSVGHPVDVGSYPPNPFGLYEMSGNVWEWCNDWYENDYYSVSPSHNPAGAPRSFSHVIRGGCWLSSADLCRTANRSFNYAEHGYFYGGFGIRIIRRLPR